jgi:hypothetical protein
MNMITEVEDSTGILVSARTDEGPKLGFRLASNINRLRRATILTEAAY